MTKPNTSPVSLAAGSYDYDVLKDGLEKAAKDAKKRYGQNVDKALAAASTGPDVEADPRAIPGYEFVDVENEDLGVTESVQVFDEKLAEEQGEAGVIIKDEAAPPPARSSAATNTKE